MANECRMQHAPGDGTVTQENDRRLQRFLRLRKIAQLDRHHRSPTTLDSGFVEIFAGDAYEYTNRDRSFWRLDAHPAL